MTAFFFFTYLEKFVVCMIFLLITNFKIISELYKKKKSRSGVESGTFGFMHLCTKTQTLLTDNINKCLIFQNRYLFELKFLNIIYESYFNNNNNNMNT